jgi:hypothetical protein
MLKKIKAFFTGEKKVEVTSNLKMVEEQPVFKEVAYEPKKCGCGRSSTGLCAGLHALSQDEWDNHADNPNKVVAPVVEAVPEPVVSPAPAPKRPRAKKASKKSK